MGVLDGAVVWVRDGCTGAVVWVCDDCTGAVVWVCHGYFWAVVCVRDGRTGAVVWVRDACTVAVVWVCHGCTGAVNFLVAHQAAHLAVILHHLRGPPVPLADEQPRGPRPLVLQLSRGHDDGVDAHRLARQLRVEALPAPLLAPDAQDQGHLELGDVALVLQKVLRDVDGELLQKNLRNVVVALDEHQEG
eukprot:7806493-Pyramimonas_sp.AAC.1